MDTPHRPTMSAAATAYALAPAGGRTIPLLGGVARVLAAAEHTDGTLMAVEWDLPEGFALPPHRRGGEDLAVYVLAGSLRVCCDDDEWVADTGAFVLLPRGAACALAVAGDRPARVLAIAWPAGLEELLVEAGAADATNPHRLAPIAAKYRVQAARIRKRRRPSALPG